MVENPRRGRQARNFTTNLPKILVLKSSSEQIFSKNCRWVPLQTGFNTRKTDAYPRGGVHLGIIGGGVLFGTPNPDPISDPKMSLFTPVFSP